MLTLQMNVSYINEIVEFFSLSTNNTNIYW